MEPGRSRRLVTAALVLAMFLAALEATAVGTALPTVVADLGGVNRYSWVFSAYLLTSTTTVPMYGKLADLFGRRRIFATGVALFLLGALWRRTTPKAAELSMFVGEPVCVVLILANSLHWPTWLWPSWLNFMFLSFLLFIAMVIFMIIVSLNSRPTPSEKMLPSLKDINKENVTSLVKFAAIILAMIMIGLYIIFH